MFFKKQKKFYSPGIQESGGGRYPPLAEIRKPLAESGACKKKWRTESPKLKSNNLFFIIKPKENKCHFFQNRFAIIWKGPPGSGKCLRLEMN
jgi:hypothetical protein